MSGDTKRVLEVNQIDNLQGSTQRVKQETTLNNLRGITQRVYVVGGGGSAPVIDELNVTPSTSAQTITAPEGVDGYSPVNVSAVTSAIDANIVAGNIKDGVEILGVTGNYTGSAPAYYIEKKLDANGKLISGGSSIINLTGVSEIGAGALAYAYYNNLDLSGSLDLSNIKKISGASGLNSAFSDCTGITSVNLSGLEEVTGLNAMQAAFQNCTNISGIIDLSSLKIINATNACQSLFRNCTSITSAKIGDFLSITGSNAFAYAFYGCTALSNVDVSKITNIASGVFNYCFNQCTGLNNSELWFSSLANIDGGAYQSACFNNCFVGQTRLKVYFPSLKTFTSNCLSQIFNNATACEIHLPSNIPTTIGGGGATIYRDLPSTNPLTGADTNVYDRNAFYDTSSALGWRIGQNWETPYYTSGTTRPSVGDTIYSDAACTTAVTTISSIA